MKGRVSQRLKTWIDSATTSISPVAMSLLTILSGRARTRPRTAMQYSNLSSAAAAFSSGGASASTTAWVTP